MLDLFGKSRADEALLNNGTVFDSTLLVSFQKFQLLDNVGIFLVILAVLMDVGKESPVIEVIDGILEDSIHCTITPEATTEPGREQLHWFVRGVIRRSI